MGFNNQCREIWIDIVQSQKNAEQFSFQILSPLFREPEKMKLEVFTDLLDYAHGMHITGICFKSGWLFVSHAPYIDNLNQLEVDTAIDNVGYYSFDIHEKFISKYKDLIK